MTAQTLQRYWFSALSLRLETWEGRRLCRSWICHDGVDGSSQPGDASGYHCPWLPGASCGQAEPLLRKWGGGRDRRRGRERRERKRQRLVSAFTLCRIVSGVDQLGLDLFSGAAAGPPTVGLGEHRLPTEQCSERNWVVFLISSFSRFCSTRSLTYLKRSLRIMISQWTIFSLQRESSPRGVSAQSQQESHGPRWVTMWHQGQPQYPVASSGL